MKLVTALACALALLAGSSVADARAPTMIGRLLDASTGAPVRDGIVTVGNRELKLGADALFQIPSTSGRIQVRAPGYRRGTASRSTSLAPSWRRSATRNRSGSGS